MNKAKLAEALSIISGVKSKMSASAEYNAPVNIEDSPYLLGSQLAITEYEMDKLRSAISILEGLLKEID